MASPLVIWMLLIYYISTRGPRRERHCWVSQTHRPTPVRWSPTGKPPSGSDTQGHFSCPVSQDQVTKASSFLILSLLWLHSTHFPSFIPWEVPKQLVFSNHLTTRRGRAAQPQCQQRPQRSGAQGGHLLVRLLLRRRRLGRSTWGGGPDRGAPTFSSPPPTSAAHGLARRPEAQTSVSPLPAPQVRRSWAAATASARSLAETCSGVQRSSLVCPSASAASSHLKPRPAVAAARPRRLRHPGVSRRKKRRPELRAEGSTMSPQTPPRLANPRRVRTRLNSLGAGASLRAGPLPGVVLGL